jgi:thioredoxin 1
LTYRRSKQKRKNEYEQRRGEIMVLKQKGKFVVITFIMIILAGIFFFMSANAQNNVKASPVRKLPRIVDVGADKCIPCIQMSPELEKLKKEYAGALEVEFIDVWKRPQDAEPYKVRGIPTQIFYDASGKEIARHLGFISKDDILAKFKSLGIVIVKADAKGR